MNLSIAEDKLRDERRKRTLKSSKTWLYSLNHKQSRMSNYPSLAQKPEVATHSSQQCINNVHYVYQFHILLCGVFCTQKHRNNCESCVRTYVFNQLQLLIMLEPFITICAVFQTT